MTRRWPAVVFLAACAGLVSWNLRVLFANQDSYAPWDALHERSVTLVEIAELDDYYVSFYRLRMLRGKTLVMSADRARALRWQISRVSRAVIEEVPDRIVLPAATCDRIRDARGRAIGVIDYSRRVDFVFDPTASRYVLAERDGDVVEDLILPEAMYEAAK